MISRRTPLFVFALGALALGACECIKTVPQCPDGVKCITYDQYCDQANASLWAMGQVCGVIAKDVPYPAAYPQRDVRCTEELRLLIDGGTVAFNPVAAQLCIEGRKTTCDPICRWDLPLAGPWGTQAPLTRCSPPCDRIFTGTKETGESCSLSAECLEGLWCDATKSCPGRCARQISDGDPTPGLEACRSPLMTKLIDGGLRCDDLLDAGAPCAIADDEATFRRCRAGFACGPKPEEADGGDGGLDAGHDDAGIDGGLDAGVDGGSVPLICIPWPDAGTVPDFSCEQSGCPFGQICNTQHQCVALGQRDDLCAPFSASGEACLGGLLCAIDQMGLAQCRNATTGTDCRNFHMGQQAGECDWSSYCGDLSCVARGTSGASCSLKEPCATGLLCAVAADGGFVCGPPSSAGQSCGDDGGHLCAFGFTCFDGGCLANSCLPSP